MSENLVNKKILALHFDRSARTYEPHAGLQREIAFQLAERAFPTGDRRSRETVRVLEIGCGTGFLTNFLLERLNCEILVALDLSGGMLAQAGLNLSWRSPPTRLLLADGEQLPLCECSFDLAASSTTFQWFNDLESSLRGIHRVLRPGGLLAFATLVQGTYRELRESYRTAAGQLGICLAAGRYGPALPGASEIAGMLARSGFSAVSLKEQAKYEFFPSAPAFLRSIKKRGASNPDFRPMNPATEKALLGKLTDFYDRRFRVDGMVYATYQVAFVQAVREG